VNAGHAILAVALAIAALTFWLAYEPTPEATDEGSSSTRPAADVITRDTWLTTMTTEGLPDRTLRAAEGEYFDKRQGTELVMPHLTIYRADGAPWEIRAERGRTIRGGDIITLEGSVVIERESATGGPPTRFTTNRLRVHPKRDFAETNDRVAMTNANGRIDAVGMRAWLGTPAKVKLLSQAKGHYVPH
jgi:lipopolysaccharide export system protein LptC